MGNNTVRKKIDNIDNFIIKKAKNQEEKIIKNFKNVRKEISKIIDSKCIRDAVNPEMYGSIHYTLDHKNYNDYFNVKLVEKNEGIFISGNILGYAKYDPENFRLEIFPVMTTNNYSPTCRPESFFMELYSKKSGNIRKSDKNSNADIFPIGEFHLKENKKKFEEIKKFLIDKYIFGYVFGGVSYKN